MEEMEPDGEVRIKMPEALSWFATNASIQDEDGKLIWEGKLGSVAQFYLEQKTKVVINGGNMSTQLEAIIDPKGNPRFEMVIEPGVHFLTHYILNRVDVVDSGR